MNALRHREIACAIIIDRFGRFLLQQRDDICSRSSTFAGISARHTTGTLAIPPIRAEQGDGLARHPGHRNANQISVSDDSIGRIELDPAGTADVNLTPGMGGSPLPAR